MIRRLTALLLFLLLAGLASPLLAADADAQMIRAGQINEVITRLQQQVKSNPNDATALNLLARAYYSVENWDAAIDANQRALKLQPGSSEFHVWMGRAYGEKADTVGALRAANLARKTKSEFEKAVQLNPVDTQSRLDLSEYYIQAPAIMGGGLDKARAQADATARFDLAASHLILARIAQQQKDVGTAEAEFKAAIATAKNPSTYWMNLASFYETLGRYPEMEKAITMAVNTPNRAACVLYDAAVVLNRSRRNLPGALQYLKQYLAEGQFDEDSPAFRAHFMLGQVLQKLNRRADAAVEYRTALAMASDFKKAQAALDNLQS